MERIPHDRIPAGLYEPLLRVNAFVDAGGLDFGLLELCRLRISQINRCAYCIDLHHKEAKRAGLYMARLVLLPAWREAPGFTMRERLALEFAEAFTRLEEGAAVPAAADALAGAFTESEQAYLALAVAQMNMWNRLMRAFGTPPPLE